MPTENMDAKHIAHQLLDRLSPGQFAAVVRFLETNLEDTNPTQQSTETPLAGDERFFHPLAISDLAEAQGIEPFSADKVKDWFLSDTEMSDFVEDIYMARQTVA